MARKVVARKVAGTVSSAPAPKTIELVPEAGKAPANGKVTEDQIRLRAYLKWQAAGGPAGDGAAFWLAAEQELLTCAERGRPA